MTNYLKVCLVEAPCNPQAIETAVLDYLNAVYGHPAAGSVDITEAPFGLFDGELTASEEEAARAQFNGLLALAGPQLIIAQARAWFFASEKEPVYCADPKIHAPTLLAQRADGHPAWALLGAHGCWKTYSQYVDPLEAAVAVYPEDWAFLIEGADNPVDKSYPEVIFFRHLAQRLGISLTNPIYKPWDQAVLREMEQQGMSRMHVALTTTVLMVLKEVMTSRTAIMDLDTTLDRACNEYVPLFGVDRAAFRATLEKALIALGDPRYAGAIIQGSTRDFEKVGVVVNRLSRERAAAAANGKQVLWLSGKEHRPVFEGLFPLNSRP